jgi:hypothetical protein
MGTRIEAREENENEVHVGLGLLSVVSYLCVLGLSPFVAWRYLIFTQLLALLRQSTTGRTEIALPRLSLAFLSW